LNFRFLDSL